MRTRHRIKLEVTLTVMVDEDKTTLEDVLGDMEYDFASMTEHADISGTEITDWGDPAPEMEDLFRKKVMGYIRSGDNISCAKFLRETLGVSLKDIKAYIDYVSARP